MQTTLSPDQLAHFESQIEAKVRSIASVDDPAHDFLHFKRVVVSAKKLCALEGAALEIVMPAAWLHDFIIVSKSDPRRSQASRLSAEGAVHFLKSIQYPEEFLNAIYHAIEGHSFSANIEIRSKEAAIVQDADRLDGLGAIGIARCFATAGLMKRAFYSDRDPFCEERVPDDRQFTIDHFYTKLFRVADMMKTPAGKIEAAKRVEIMKRFIQQFADEV